MSLLNISSASVLYGRNVLFQDLNLVVDQRQRWGIVGRNGSGKTTLFRLITGDQDPTGGTVSRGSGLRVTMLDQHREFPGVETVWDAALSPYAHLVELEHQMLTHAAQIGELGERAPKELLERYDRDLEQFQRADGYGIDARVAAVLQGLGFDPDRARTQLIGTLSGGERGRLGLACQLVTPADLLLLDEPTNHLDLETTQWLEGHLRDLPGSVLIVSHDRAFLDAVAEHVLHLEGGTGQTYDGGYSEFVRQRIERRLTQRRAFDKQAKVIAAEEDFIRRNIAGQDSKQAKGRRRRLGRLPRLSPPPGDQGSMAVRFDIRARGGDQALVADRVRVVVEDRVLLEDFSSVIRRGDVVGLVGPNGAGKSTLLATLLGQRPPAHGSARIGDSVQVAFYRQDLAQVPQDKTIFDIINDMRPAWTRGQVQGHLGRFDFSGDEVQRRAGTLSGGERARVALAMMMLEGANLLVFDEPTNHLDVESIEALEDAIEAYEGTVLLVSHDRALLRALTTRVWALDNGHIQDFGGGFEEWELSKTNKQTPLETVVKERPSRAEKQPAQSRTQQSIARTARRKAEQAEATVHTLEARVAELEARLADSDFYADPDAAQRAETLFQELETTRKELEQAFAEWTRAAEATDQR
ncbi:MAG TPA: ABC-F family ATP-binding cassette domain-containing protein [Gemmatimonadales bacterium]|nr:ABC-F family ATP-binding cassette domain-containing protein [Gemmatimonadales bacterium]